MGPVCPVVYRYPVSGNTRRIQLLYFQLISQTALLLVVAWLVVGPTIPVLVYCACTLYRLTGSFRGDSTIPPHLIWLFSLADLVNHICRQEMVVRMGRLHLLLLPFLLAVIQQQQGHSFVTNVNYGPALRLLQHKKALHYYSNTLVGHPTKKIPKSRLSDPEQAFDKDKNAASRTSLAALIPAAEVSGVTATSTAASGEVKPSLFWRGVVLFICIVWSTNFVVLKEIYHAAPTLDPSLYAAIRFSLAAAVLLPRTFNSIKNTDLILGSMTIGLSIFFGYFGQSIGLQTTDAGKSAFICSLNVVWVALVSGILKKQFKVQTWISALLAVSGVALLETDGGHELTSGDLWCFMQPIGFGSGYVMLEYLIAKFPQNAGAITAFKLLATAIASITWATLSGHTFADLQPVIESPVAVGGLLYMGLVTSAAMLWLQSYAFKNVPATDVSIILTFEPISASIFASFLLGEALTQQDILGGALIVFACISNELNLFSVLLNKIRGPKPPIEQS